MSDKRGMTSSQIKQAPAGALYIWPVGASMIYVLKLAEHLGRRDLTFVNPSIFDDGGVALRQLTRPIVVDHAVNLAPDQRRALTWYQSK